MPGPSGAMSSLLPLLDAFLGIEMSNKDLNNLLKQFELSMPVRHRQYLAHVRAQLSCREFLAGLLARGSTAECSHDAQRALVRKFNSCVNAVLDFRWSHFNFVKKYVIEQVKHEESPSPSPRPHLAPSLIRALTPPRPQPQPPPHPHSHTTLRLGLQADTL